MQRGNVLFFLLIGLVILIGVSGGAYYLGKSQSMKSVSQGQVIVTQTPTATSKTPSPTIDNHLPSVASPTPSRQELNGFPVYPGATFIESKTVPTCQDGQYSGFSICNVKTYTWQVNATFDDISAFYRQDKSKSGW